MMTRLLRWIFRTGNRIGVSKERELSNVLLKTEKKNKLLSDNLDLDYLDMIYREKLKLGKKEEIIIKLQ